jgi:hypothetical protein
MNWWVFLRFLLWGWVLGWASSSTSILGVNPCLQPLWFDEFLLIPQSLGFSSSSKIGRKIDGVLYPRVPRFAGYRLKIWIRLVPSSDKWLGNQVLHTGYGPTTTYRREGVTNLKRNQTQEWSIPTLSPITVFAGCQKYHLPTHCRFSL